MRLQKLRRLGCPALGLRRVAGSGTPLRGRGSRQAPREMLSSWRATGEGAARSGAAALCAPRGTRVPGSPQTWDPMCGQGWASRRAEQFHPRKLRMEPFFPHCVRGRIAPRVPPRGPQCGGAAPLG